MPKGKKLFRGKGGKLPPDSQADFFEDDDDTQEDAAMSDDDDVQREVVVDEDDTPELDLTRPQDIQLPDLASSSLSQKHMDISTREGSPVIEVKRKRMKVERKYTTLKPEEEVELMEWYRDNELFYNKKLGTYRDRTRKAEIKEEQAKKMNKTVEMIESWMLNMRTRYSKLLDDKSGQATREMTERDQWIYTSFEFLRPHIVRCPTRTSKKVVPARQTEETPEGSQMSTARPPRPQSSASADIDDPAPLPDPHQPDVLQERLNRAMGLQQELIAPQNVALSTRLIRDAHSFAETFLENATEDTARAYSLEVIKLATGFVEFEKKETPYRPKVQLTPIQSLGSTSLSSLSPLLQQQQQQPPRYQQMQRSSWGGQTPSYGRPAATPVLERQALEEASMSFLRDFEGAM